MGIILFSIKRHVSVIVGILLVTLFCYISLTKIPIQMKPTVDKPIITVQTAYPGAAPAEIEEQITIPLEEKLKSVESMTRMTSRSQEGRSSIQLEFDWGVNKDVATIDVMKKVNQVKNLPDESEETTITSASSDETNRIIWMAMKSTKHSVNEMYKIADSYLKPRLERVAGIGDLRIYGGAEEEIHVLLDYEEMALRGIALKDLQSALVRENVNMRGGKIEEGKKQFTVRTVGLFKSLEDIENVIIRQNDDGSLTYVKDIATVEAGYKDTVSIVKERGDPMVAISASKRTGANTIEVIEGIREKLKAFNESGAFEGITVATTYDESEYIWESINFVRSNILLGAIFAVAVLIFFLRSPGSIFVIGAAIPITLFATIIAFYFLDRSLNVISLAGIAFAVGLVVDNAIVVLENIHRHLHLKEKKDIFTAVVDGTHEVWQAILASTITTIAVFLPIIFVQDEAGQLFKDIAIAICAAVLFSLIVSLTVIPMLASRITLESKKSRWKMPGFDRIIRFGEWAYNKFIAYFEWIKVGIQRKLKVIGAVFVVFILTLFLLPSLEYLPSGNRNLVLVIMKTPIGTSLQKEAELSVNVTDKLKAGLEQEMRYMFSVVAVRFKIIGIAFKDEYKGDIPALMGKVNGLVKGSPGYEYVFATQANLFSRSLGKNLEVDILGEEFEEIENIADDLKAKIMQVKGVQLVRSSLELGNPEYQVKINRAKAAEAGFSLQDVAELVESYVGGKIVTRYKKGGDEIDITVRSKNKDLITFADLDKVTLFSPSGQPVYLSSIAKIEVHEGPSRIDHVEMERSVTLSVNVDKDTTLQEVMDELQKTVVADAQKDLKPGYYITFAGTASDLTKAIDSLSNSFLLAIIIVFLVMAALFESFFVPFIILFTVPLAVSGAILGLRITGADFNILTLMGFIILVGIVVNNGILIIHQALNNEEKGMEKVEAFIESCKTRIRPIFMSNITTICGLLPLTLRGGSGSEIYQGFGSAIVGGLTLAAVVTLILIPAVYLLVSEIKDKYFSGMSNTDISRKLLKQTTAKLIERK